MTKIRLKFVDHLKCLSAICSASEVPHASVGLSGAQIQGSKAFDIQVAPCTICLVSDPTTSIELEESDFGRAKHVLDLLLR